MLPRPVHKEKKIDLSTTMKNKELSQELSDLKGNKEDQWKK